ncbi:MAG: hypothetical protein MOGMAGMI_01860 [Candidatus Omnitrophica bacterium]|nr:hypothetical protein [Candidatus Omnitrophota bacterium]
MWQDIPDIIKALAAATTATLAVWRWLRPRKLIRYLVAVWNYERLVANANGWMAEANRQEQWGQRWMHQHEACQKELSRLDEEVAHLRTRLAALDESVAGGR